MFTGEQHKIRQRNGKKAGGLAKTMEPEKEGSGQEATSVQTHIVTRDAMEGGGIKAVIRRINLALLCRRNLDCIRLRRHDQGMCEWKLWL